MPVSPSSVKGGCPLPNHRCPPCPYCLSVVVETVGNVRETGGRCCVSEHWTPPVQPLWLVREGESGGGSGGREGGREGGRGREGSERKGEGGRERGRLREWKEGGRHQGMEGGREGGRGGREWERENL